MFLFVFQNLEEELKEAKSKLEEMAVNVEKAEKTESIEALNRKLLSEIALLQKEKLQTEGELNDVQKHLKVIKSEFIELKWHILELLVQEASNVLTRHQEDAESSAISSSVFTAPGKAMLLMSIASSTIY